jgi:hypothetical protein
MALGPSENRSAACWYQGLSSTGNYLSSVFWTSIITYQVYAVVVKEQGVLRDMRRIHRICWGLPLFLTFIPLSTSTYNNPDDETTWCFVADRKDSPPWSQLFWFIVSFYAWLWMAMLWTAYMLVAIAWKLRQLKAVPVVIMSTIGKLALYPVIITVCWVLNTVANIYTFSTGRTYTELSTSWIIVTNLGVVMATLQGLLNTLVFFAANKLVREYWLCWIEDCWYSCCGLKHEENADIASAAEAAQAGVGAAAETNEDVVGHNGGRTSQPAQDRRLSTQRTSSVIGQSSRGLKIALAVEAEADYVGEPEITVPAVMNNTTSTPGGGLEELPEPPAFSTDTVSTPLGSMMQGWTRTASGWWEAARLSSASVRSSFNFGPSNATAGTGVLAQPSLSSQQSYWGRPSSSNMRMNSVAASSSSGGSSRLVSRASASTAVELQQRPSAPVNTGNPLHKAGALPPEP